MHSVECVCTPLVPSAFGRNIGFVASSRTRSTCVRKDYEAELVGFVELLEFIRFVCI
jgi:hypothetical protein